MYTYRLITSFGITTRIDIYKDRQFTYMSKTGAWTPEEAKKLADTDVAMLNASVVEDGVIHT